MNTLNLQLLHASWRSWLGSDNAPVGPRWLSVLWTFVFCCACALFFGGLGYVTLTPEGLRWRTDVGWWHFYGINLVVALCIGFTVRGLFYAGYAVLGYHRIRAWAPWKRFLYFAGLPLVGVALGGTVGAWLVGARFVIAQGVDDARAIAFSLAAAALIAALFSLFFYRAARRLQAEKRATLAQLRLLQGQIEPHFLFNTLANVASLMDEDVPKARRMLERFTDYLRASLSGLRQDVVALQSELDMAENYLGLMQARMEDRLQYAVDVPADLRAIPLPPLLLQPLLENAIHHGLEPKVAGGRVTIRGWREGRALMLEVRDDGLGLNSARRRTGNGMALDNLRARLLAQYGPGARLELHDAQPGTRVVLQLPLAAGDAP